MPPSKTASGWTEAVGLFQEERMLRAGIRHGVTTRTLGDMKSAPQRREALRRAEISSEDSSLLRQVHGAGIVVVSAAAQPPRDVEGDGWLIDAAGFAVGVFIADCIPLFVWEESGRAAGVFHAGWRGVHAGMPRRAVEAFREIYGTPPARLKAAVGPRIGACCYKVGPEMSALFGPRSLTRRGEALHLDLGAEAKAQLVEAGLPEGEVSVSPECTACREDLFFSYRRQKTGGRMLAFMCRGSA